MQKKIELRVFVAEGEFYAMAIFSQSNLKTGLDFRNYDLSKANRCVPYDLEESIKVKLILLLDKLELKTGSIDMIIDTEGQYIFLEVNASGQFTWLSNRCNYYIEKRIATKYL